MPDSSPGSRLEYGREAFLRHHWLDAFRNLELADQDEPLEGPDLEQLGFAAHLSGHDDEGFAALERAHQWQLAAGDPVRAARVAIWLSLGLMNRGDVVRGSGWFARARRLLEEQNEDCVESGYLLIPIGLQGLASGELEAASATFAQAAQAGERFADSDLTALGRLGFAQAAIRLGSRAEGTSLLDEVMVSVTTREVSPLVVGIIYCAVIDTCQAMFDLRRAHEWTESLRQWCESQPDLVPFRGQCLAYRAEIMRFHGAWPEALSEAQKAHAILSGPPPHPALGLTLYQQAESYRLRGEFAHAERAYREASRWGRPPEPGLALLRLSQGRVKGAEASIRRALGEGQDPLTRARLLPAFVEIVLAAGDIERARRAADELAAIAAELEAPLLNAEAAYAQGHVLLAEAKPVEALGALRRARAEWQDLDAPYELARIRVLMARACAALDDADTAELELDAAREAFEDLGALGDLAAVERLSNQGRRATAGALTAREVEVLRLIAEGKTNREIASGLVVSEKTVARHVSNILAKLDLPSRAAATAYAFREGLV